MECKTQKFNLKCNTSMVDLEIVNEHQEELWLRKCIERHQRYTGSSKAKNLLANWDQIIKRVVKVMPIEYRAVLESMKNKGRFQKYLEELPIMALIDPEAGLFSAACRAHMIAESSEKLN